MVKDVLPDDLLYVLALGRLATRRLVFRGNELSRFGSVVVKGHGILLRADGD